MHVLIPVSGDPSARRASGILAYSLGLARFLHNQRVGVELLCTGPPSLESDIPRTSVTLESSGEIRFVRALARHVRARKIPDDTVVIANSELYVRAFRRVRPHPRIILIAHGPTLPTLSVRRPLLGLAFRFLVEPSALRGIECVVAIDRESQEYFSRRYPTARIRRIPLAIDTQHFRPVSRKAARAQWQLGTEPTLLFVGRLAAEKCPDRAVAVLERLLTTRPDATLLVAGTGPLLPDLERARSRLGNKRLRLLGFVASENLPSLYSSADALLLPSRIEQFPTVVVESLACGSQVIATDVGDVRHILDDPALGVVCNPSVDALAAAVSQRIPEDNGQRTRHEGARTAAARRFSWDLVGPQILDVLRSL